MGYFSKNCAHCEHPLLPQESTDRGINEWMNEGIAFSREGDRVSGSYNGYGELDDIHNIYDEFEVWVHRACWEASGRPDVTSYEKDSTHAADQGFFFEDGAHDLIDPRITDETERARLLKEGVEARSKCRFDQKARDACNMLRKFDSLEDYEDTYPPLPEGGFELPWKRRYHVSSYMGPQKMMVYAVDRLTNKEVEFDAATEEEMAAHCKNLWETFVVSPEASAYKNSLRNGVFG